MKLVNVAFTVNISSTHFDLSQIAFARVGAGECPNREGLVTLLRHVALVACEKRLPVCRHHSCCFNGGK